MNFQLDLFDVEGFEQVQCMTLAISIFIPARHGTYFILYGSSERNVPMWCEKVI